MQEVDNVEHAREDALALVVRYPVVYATFRACLHGMMPVNLHAFAEEFRDVEKLKDVYNLWSTVIANLNHTQGTWTPTKPFCIALKATLNDELIIACQFLARALDLDVKGQQLAFLLDIWELFLDVFHTVRIKRKIDLDVWCRLFDMCVENILSSGKCIRQFLSTPHLNKAIFGIERFSEFLPTFVGLVFATPTIIYNRDEDTNNIVEAELHHPYGYAKGWDLGFTEHHALTWNQGISNVDLPVLSEKNFRALYEIADDVFENYKNGSNFRESRDSFELYSDRAQEALNHLIRHSLELLTGENAKKEAMALASFYLAHSADVDRYTMARVLNVIQDDSPEDTTHKLQLVNSFSRLHSPIKVRDGLYHLAYIPHFENAPYLRRFKVDGKIYLSSESFPGASDAVVNRFCRGPQHNVEIDTMFVDKYSLVFLRVNYGGSVNVSGHFPILAGYDNRTQTALYVALIHLQTREEDPWYFTCVAEGAKEATFIDEIGEVKRTDRFFVLGLRYDPSDVVPPYPQTHKGAMDPTGPLHWLSFWPKKDSEYFEDERLKKADDALESILLEIGGENEKILLSGFGEAVDSEGRLNEGEEGRLSWFYPGTIPFYSTNNEILGSTRKDKREEAKAEGTLSTSDYGQSERIWTYERLLSFSF